MEYRHYVTFALSAIVLQLLIYNAVKTISWLFNLNAKPRKVAYWLGYLGGNSLIVLHFLKLIVAFRLLAWLLVLLLFAFYARLLILCISWFTAKNPVVQRSLRVIYPLAFFGLIGLAVYNAYMPRVVHYQVNLDKPLAKPLRIGMASDLHLGKWFGGQQLDRLAEIFKQQQVDLILLPGDIMDDNVSAYLAENMRPHLAKLTAPLGVYATLGNHDFLGQPRKIAQEIERAGIKVLWDQAVEIDGKFAVVGRNDELNKMRPTTKKLIEPLNKQLPIFLMDHRPSEIETHAKLPIDLQVSGHTHRGQIFPANLVTASIYPLDYGYAQFGLGHYVVTSGYGFWGVPMRLGSQSEVVIIDVTGK